MVCLFVHHIYSVIKKKEAHYLHFVQYLYRLKVRKEIRGGDLNYIKYTVFYQSIQYIEWVIYVLCASFSILSSSVFYGLCSYCINFHIFTKCEKTRSYDSS